MTETTGSTGRILWYFMRWAWPRATYVEWLENVEMHQADHQLHCDVYGHTLRDRTGDGLSSWGANRQGVHSYVQACMHSHLRQLQSEHKRPFPTLWGDPSVLTLDSTVRGFSPILPFPSVGLAQTQANPQTFYQTSEGQKDK